MDMDPDLRLYQARLFCEQARIALEPLRLPLIMFLLDMAVLEIRAVSETQAQSTRIQPDPVTSAARVAPAQRSSG